MLFTRRFLLILVVAILGAGCATGPKFAEMKSSIPALRAGDGRIYLYRDSIIGAAIQPKVYLNGTEVGVSQANAFFFIDRPAGDYKVSAASEVERSLSLALAPNETKFVRASISIGLLVGRINFELVNAAGGQTAIEGLTYTGTAAGNSVAAAPNGAIATGSVAPALLMSKADADALEGTWSGNYKCGPYIGSNPPTTVSPFTVPVNLTLSSSQATLNRSTAGSYKESMTGSVGADLNVAMNGRGEFTNNPQSYWLANMNGKFSKAAPDAVFTAKGNLTTPGGQVLRQCEVELTRSKT